MAQLTVGRDPKTGKRQRVTYYGKTRQEVRTRLNEAKYKLAKNKLVKPSSLTLGKWIDEWLQVYKKNSVKQSTYLAYQSWVVNHIKPVLGQIPLHKLRTDHIQRFLNEARNKTNEELKLSAISIRHIIRVLNMALGKAIELNKLDQNVLSGVVKPAKEDFEINPWSIEEKNLFLNSARGHRLYALFLIALEGGLRRGELLGLRWPDIDWERGRLAVMRSLNVIEGGTGFGEPKAGSKRTITLPRKVVDELARWKEKQDAEKDLLGKCYRDQGLIFCTQLGTPIHPRDLNRYFDQLIERAGVRRIRLHDTRHTHATILLRLGVNPRIVQKRLGHKDIAITLQIYSHFVPELDEEAADKLNEALVIQGIEE